MFQRQCLLRSCLLLILGCLLLSQSLTTTYADGAPPPFPEGSSIGPNTDKTKVRMVSETVTVAIQQLDGTVSPIYPEHSYEQLQAWIKAKVEATFVLRNVGEQDEAFDVWFPLGDMYGASEEIPDIADFAAWVDGNSSTITNHPPRIPSSEYEHEKSLKDDKYWYSFVPWASWPVRFPVGKDVIVSVSYTQYPRGDLPTGDFTYILQTGSGWYDTIGEGTVTFKLPYPVSFENARPAPWLNMTWLNGYRINNDNISWHFTNLEPDGDSNITLCVITPARWMAVIDARKAILLDPKSPAAHFKYAVALARIRSNVSKQHCDDESSANYDDMLYTVGDLRQKYAPSDRADLYFKYGLWFTGIHTPDDLTGRDLENRDKVLEVLNKDFEQWPDDPIYLLVKSLIESPDFVSYTDPPQILPDPVWFYGQ